MKKRILKWLYIACLTTLVATVSFIIGVMLNIVNFCAGFVVSYFTDFSMVAMIIYIVCYLILFNFI